MHSEPPKSASPPLQTQREWVISFQLIHLQRQRVLATNTRWVKGLTELKDGQTLYIAAYKCLILHGLVSDTYSMLPFERSILKKKEAKLQFSFIGHILNQRI